MGQTVTFHIDADGSGVAQTVDVENKHTIQVDTYESFGGADSAASPLAYALSALTSCNQVTASIVAKDLGIRLGSWRFSADGVLDPSVLVGGAEGNANFSSVTVRATVQTDAGPDAFEKLQSETERRCPVTQLFRRSGLELSTHWQAESLPQD